MSLIYIANYFQIFHESVLNFYIINCVYIFLFELPAFSKDVFLKLRLRTLCPRPSCKILLFCFLLCNKLPQNMVGLKSEFILLFLMVQ